MKKSVFSSISLLFLIGAAGCSSTSHKSYFVQRGLAQAELGGCFDRVAKILSRTDFSENTEKFRRLVESTENRRNEKAILQAVDALYFVDFEHSSRLLNAIYRDEDTLARSKFPYLYNVTRYRGFRNTSEPALENFLKARKFLVEEDPDYTMETFLKTHKKFMTGGVEGADAGDIGKVRTGQWYGNESGTGITKEAYQNLKDNIYIKFEKTGERGGRIQGKIWYPNLENASDEILSRVSATLRRRVKEAQASGDVSNEALERELLTALTEERFDNFIRKRARLGELTTANRIEKYIELVAQFQRDLVSIHPLANGNGRTTREFGINFALMKEGLPPARLVSTSNDLYLSEAQWADEIKDGVINSMEMFEDFNYRKSVGLPLETSPYIAFPSYPKALDINYRKYNSTRVTKDYHERGVDINQYAQFFEQKYPRTSQIPGMTSPNNYDAIDIESVNKEFIEFYKKNRVLYKHKKEGDQIVSLNFADREFRMTFGDRAYRDADLFKRKMDKFYTDDVVWRGLASRHEEMSEDEIVTMFSSFHHQFLSNRVVGTVRNPNNQRQIRKEILKDFKQYNDDLFEGNGDLVRMAKDHSETGPLYSTSYGYSTSKNRTVGKAFAMGAMVVAEYGQQMDYQHLLKSRVLVGMRRANKDVDLTRLKQVRNNFSYRYGRQQEVMGVGGTDPDAVGVVQTIDAEGEVIFSYIRNEKNPSEVWVIKGEADSVIGVPRSRVIKKIDLPDEAPDFNLEAFIHSFKLIVVA